MKCPVGTCAACLWSQWRRCRDVLRRTAVFRLASPKSRDLQGHLTILIVMSVEERVLRLQKCTLAGDMAEELNARSLFILESGMSCGAGRCTTVDSRGWRQRPRLAVSPLELSILHAQRSHLLNFPCLAD